jgi:hypothetical protein
MKGLEIRNAYRIQEWNKVIGERHSSGQSVKDYCAGKGITVRQYYYWLRKCREQITERIAVAMDVPKLVPVALPMKGESAKQYVLRYRSAEITIPEGASRETLNVILEALDSHAE